MLSVAVEKGNCRNEISKKGIQMEACGFDIPPVELRLL